MRDKKYLNFILTINAVLLACLLWTQVAEKGILAEDATAQVRDRRPGTRNLREVGPPITIPNASSQRQAAVDEMKKLNRTLEALKSHIEGGSLTVEVTNADDLDG